MAVAAKLEKRQARMGVKFGGKYALKLEYGSYMSGFS